MDDVGVVVVGSSGFGREVLDVLEAMGRAGATLQVAGIVDDSPSQLNQERIAARGFSYLGTVDEWLAGGPRHRYVLGIGSPQVRSRLVARINGVGLRPFTAIHPAASVGSACSIGEGAVICAGAVVSTNVRLGRHVHLNPNCTIGHDSVLEDYVSVNPGAIISGEVTVESETLVGAGAIILQQLRVGAGSVIGASALATREVPSRVVLKGVPGRWSE